MTLDELDLAFDTSLRVRHGSRQFASMDELIEHLKETRGD